MKTTVEISDSLFEAAKRLAQREGTTMRALIEEGLRRLLGERRSRRSGFKLRSATFRGEGLLPEHEGADWSDIRRKSYEGRGG
jgi:hypothetical protein